MEMNLKRFIAALAVVLCCIGSTPVYGQTTTPTPPPTESGLDSLLRALAVLADLIEILTALGQPPPPAAPLVLCELTQESEVILGPTGIFLPGDEFDPIITSDFQPLPPDRPIRTFVQPRRNTDGTTMPSATRCTFPGVRIVSMEPNPPTNPLGIRNPNGDARVDLIYDIEAFDTRMKGGCRPLFANLPETNGMACSASTVLNYRFNEQPAVPTGGMTPPTQMFDTQLQRVTLQVIVPSKNDIRFLIALITGT